ncbi:thioredoxin family protein [Streptomyces uncialis]|uniref:thioredoxin family protein n=1 Tax=Streptomyces uncialis TaxID=1048205 RepID=UPI00381AB048
MTQTTEATDANFDALVLHAPGPVLTHFWAEWSGPCKMLRPMLAELVDTYTGRLTITELNVDHNPRTAPQHNVRGLPTLHLFHDGRIIATRVGALSKGQLTEFLDQNLPT